MGVLYESHIGVFLLLVVALGGGAAWMTGRAVAVTWRPLWVLAWFTFLLTVAVRFLSFSLFQETLLSLQFLIVDFVVLFAIAFAGWRVTRTTQMTTQYVWLYEKTSPFGWRLKEGQTDPYAAD